MITSKERRSELANIAHERCQNIMDSWWMELGSWDDMLEDEQLTIDELEWIWDNISVSIKTTIRRNSYPFQRRVI